MQALFLEWAAGHCEDAALINTASSAQIGESPRFRSSLSPITACLHTLLTYPINAPTHPYARIRHASFWRVGERPASGDSEDLQDRQGRGGVPTGTHRSAAREPLCQGKYTQYSSLLEDKSYS